jgi:hypothetical protein
MSNRKSYFFRQRVTEAELDAGFDDLEKADHDLAGDLGFTGVLANAVVSQHAPVADLTVDVSGPAAILDQHGQRIFFSSLQNVSVAHDDNGVATAVSAAGKEKVVSVFIRFDRALSDPRVDGNSLTVFFHRDESFKFIVAQGAEADAGGAIPPTLRPDAILLADVVRRFGQTQILADSISTARRQDTFTVPGAPRSLRRGRTLDVVADLLAFYNAHANATADRHAAAAIDFAGGGAWADGAANPATTVEAQLDKLVADLAAAGGATKIGAAATPGVSASLGAGSVKSQLDALLASVNAHLVDPEGAHAASAIAYAGGPPWKDGTANPATTVEAQLDKLVGDLASDGGAGRLGAAARASWLDGRANPAGVSVLAALNKIVVDLSDQAADADGAARIGAQAAGNLPAGSVRSQLNALDATAVRTNVANVYTAPQTLNGADGDTHAAIVTTAPRTLRKLLWEVATGAGVRQRVYATTTTLEFTVNASWDGTQWVKDSIVSGSSKLELNTFELRFNTDDSTTHPFPGPTFLDTWPSSIGLPAVAHGQQSLDAGGNWISTGVTESYAGWQGFTGAAESVGAGASFRKAFPSTPSTVTVLILSSLANTTSAFITQPTAHGVGVTVGVSTNTTALFYARVIAS